MRNNNAAPLLLLLLILRQLLQSIFSTRYKEANKRQRDFFYER